MISLFSAIEDVPAEAIQQGVTDGKTWESFPEYLDAIDRRDLVCDIAALMPHSCVRTYVLGPERGDLSDTLRTIIIVVPP